MKLREYLRENEITQTKAAKELKVHPNYIFKLVNGRSIPSESLAKRIEIYTNGKVKASDIRPTIEETPPRYCPTCDKRITESLFQKILKAFPRLFKNEKTKK